MHGRRLRAAARTVVTWLRDLAAAFAGGFRRGYRPTGAEEQALERRLHDLAARRWAISLTSPPNAHWFIPHLPLPPGEARHAVAAVREAEAILRMEARRRTPPDETP
ncbi:hypothetical protein ACFV3R_25545 [Streptomyces sp. NPDC059740]|uniref:hypothetical protein n=1 Tax=Streptomyces sp. NPDC059740 TaxID=3346926 RepID=UPI00364DAD59